MNTAKTLGVLMLLVAVTLTWAAAPPPRGLVRLTKEQQEHIEELLSSASAAAQQSDFETAAKRFCQVAEYRAKYQGVKHHAAIDAAFLAEEWQRMAKIPAKYRAEALQARKLVAQARQLYAMRKLHEAEKKARYALTISERILGESHTATAVSYDFLALCLRTFRKTQEALVLYKKALAIFEKVLSESHPDTAASLGNTASCLESMGKAQEALPLYKRALAACEKSLGEYHPDTTMTRDKAAACLKSLGKAQEALPLYQKSLAIRVKAFGESALPTAPWHAEVAYCLQGMGKDYEALLIYKKVLAIFEKSLGETHPSTAAVYNNVGFCLQNLGKLQEALPLYRKALTIAEKTSSESNAPTAICLNNVAFCLHRMGNAPEALPLYRKALAIFEKTAGETHAYTPQACSNVAMCLSDMDRASEALPLYKKAVAIFEKTKGETHPDTAKGYTNLATCLGKLGKEQEALPLHKKALAISEKTLGEMHPFTENCCYNVAFCLQKMGKPQEALPLYRKALAIAQKTLGESHPATARVYLATAFCHLLLDKDAEAERAFRANLPGRVIGGKYVGKSGFDRSLYLSRSHSPWQGLAICLLRQGKAAEAWAQADADLARGLLEDLDPDKGDEDRERLTQIDKLNAQIVPLLSRADLSEADRQLLDSLTKQRAKLDIGIAKAAVARFDARLLPLARVQKQIPADTAIVMWLDLDPFGHFACVLRNKGNPIWVRLPGTGKDGKWSEGDGNLPELTYLAVVAAFLSGKEQDRIVNNQETKWRPLLRAALVPENRQRYVKSLLAQRITPLEKHLEGVRRLLVVPSGDMAMTPVEVLTDKYTINYIPSASIYARRMEQHRALKGDSILVLADPPFTAATPPEPPADGVLLTAVVPGGSAARAGLLPGDVIVRVGKTKIESTDALAAALKQTPCEAIAWREGKEITVRLAEGKLSATGDPRSARAAYRAWRRENEQLTPRSEEWKPLPGTRVEAELLKRLVAKYTALEGKDANEKRLEKLAESGELKQFRLLHLATHGETNPTVARQSALILSQQTPLSHAENLRRFRDGKLPLTNRLTVDTVLRTWQLDADLVTLSACDTGLGAHAGSEGMLGFAQALLQKGARSVLLSRWKVDDAATSLLMARFYENVLGKRDLKKPLGRADALHEAKKWLRELPREDAEKRLAKLTDSLPRGERSKVARMPDRKADAPKGKEDRPFEQPYYWAAFILIGDPD